jgi:hypothetical protein
MAINSQLLQNGNLGQLLEAINSLNDAKKHYENSYLQLGEILYFLDHFTKQGNYSLLRNAIVKKRGLFRLYLWKDSAPRLIIV